MRTKTRYLFLAPVLAFCMAATAEPQDDVDRKPPMDAPAPGTREAPKAGNTSGLHIAGFRDTSGEGSRTGFSGHALDLLQDQRQIWSSPARIRFSDATWLVPLGGITAGLFVTDRQYSASFSQNPVTLRHYKTLSNVALASLVGAGAGLYLFSYPAHNEHWRETGFLAGEAALNSLITVEALKYSLQRERPYQGNGSGRFFNGGTSFPSEHSAAAWSIASVIAHEYPGTLPKLFAYGMASAVSFSRVHARQHFPSDVLIGSALGYLIAQNVYRRRHDPELGGGAWESPHEFVSDQRMRTPSQMGSPYVPLDSWIYPALARLAALGYVKTESLGMRPWTRLECARLLGEAEEVAPDLNGPAEVQELFRALAEEFAADSSLASSEQNLHAQLESVYQRSLGDLRHAPDGRLSLWSDGAERLRQAVSAGLQQHSRSLKLGGGGPLCDLCSRRISICSVGPAPSPARSWIYQHRGLSATERSIHSHRGHEPLSSAGCVRGNESRQLADLLRKTEPVVGAKRRWHDGFHQQLGTDRYVSREPGKSVSLALDSRLSRRPATRLLPGASLRTGVHQQRATWGAGTGTAMGGPSVLSLS